MGSNESDFAMTESKILKTELDALSYSFTELKDEVRSTNKDHSASLVAIRESMEVMVRLEERSLKLQDTVSELKADQVTSVNRVHQRIDSTLKSFINSQTTYTDTLMSMQEKLGKLAINQTQNSTKIETHDEDIKAIKNANRYQLGIVLIAVVGLAVERIFT